VMIVAHLFNSVVKGCDYFLLCATRARCNAVGGGITQHTKKPSGWRASASQAKSTAYGFILLSQAEAARPVL
jgi:hypothetical protein